jgi:hypothetical protein
MKVANEKIWNFYKTYPSLSFEAANLLFIDFMEKIIPDTKNGLTTSLAEQLVEQMKHLQSQMVTVTDNITLFRNENINNISVKLSEFKREYMEDIKMILTSNVSDKIAPLLKEQNSILIDKTQIFMNDILPKNNENLSKQMNESIKSLHYSITEDTNKFLSSSINPRTLQDFISNLEQKFTQSEQRIETNIREIKITNDNIREISTAHQQTSISLNATVNDMLKKMENTSTKGKISENIVFNILNSLYPSAMEIQYVGDKKESGDIMLVRENKPTILIENKNWDKIVSKDEVKKFIHDVETQNCCGLFLSQNTGIANKRNFEISIHNNKHILLFMHEVNYDAERIKLGIEIIDHFKETLDKFDDKSEIDTIDKDVLDSISKEYQECCSQKLNIIKMIKDFGVKLTKQVEDISFPNLENYLSTRYTFSVGKMVCEYCNFIAKNQQALSAHQRGCLVRKNMTKTEVLTDINTELSSSSVLAQQPTVLAIDTKVKDNKVKKVKV